MTSPAAHGFEPGARELCSTGASVSDQAIREQLTRILASQVFRNSKRYSAVLKYIVEETLAGNHERLKERTIGVDVFGREHDYDTASDHVVRSAMAEVRKRLAQYYQENGHTAELRFEVQPGSYVPQFHAAFTPGNEETSGPPGPARDAGPALQAARSLPLRRIVPIAVIAAAAASAALLLPGHGVGRDALADFWGPVLNSKAPVLLCLGNAQGGSAPGQYSPIDLRTLSMGDFHRLPSQTIHMMDAVAIARLAAFMQSHRKTWWSATQSDVSFGDLRKGPAILVGLMNNDWTERIVGRLRFHAEKIAPRTVVIRDTSNPSRNDWSMDYSTPLLKITQDYALVARVLDLNTGETVVTAAGISVFGTQAAAEFLTDARELAALDSAAPGWRRKNVEIVLAAEVVRARSGVPHIVAARAW